MEWSKPLTYTLRAKLEKAGKVDLQKHKKKEEIDRNLEVVNKVLAAIRDEIPWNRWHTPIIKKGKVVGFTTNFRDMHAYKSEVDNWKRNEEVMKWIHENKCFRIDPIIGECVVNFYTLRKAVLKYYRR